MLDGFVSLLGPARQVYARLSEREAGPPPLDTTTLAIEFVNGVSATLATIRATPFYWRVHMFGTKGSAEVLDETTMMVRKSGEAPATRRYPAVATLAAFEAALQSIQPGHPVACHTAYQ